MRSIDFSDNHKKNMQLFYLLIIFCILFLLGLGGCGLYTVFAEKLWGVFFWVLASCSLCLFLFAVPLINICIKGFRGLQKNSPAIVVTPRDIQLALWAHQTLLPIPWQHIGQITLTPTGELQLWPQPGAVATTRNNLTKGFYRGKPITFAGFTSSMAAEDLYTLLNAAKNGQGISCTQPQSIQLGNPCYSNANLWYNISLLLLVPLLIAGLVFTQTYSSMHVFAIAIPLAIWFLLILFITWVDRHVPVEIKLAPDGLHLKTVKSRTRRRRHYQTAMIPLSHITNVQYPKNGLVLLGGGTTILLQLRHLQFTPPQWAAIQRYFSLQQIPVLPETSSR